MDFYSAETGGLGIFGCFAKAGNDAREFVVSEFAGDFVRFFPLGRVCFVIRDRNGAGANRLPSVVEEGMTGSSAVPNL